MLTDGADLRHWLAIWARWMRIHSSDLGYPKHASAMGDSLSNFMAGEDDSENYWQKHRVPVVVQVIDCCIDDLDPRQKQAIWYGHGISRIPPEDVAYLYGEAFDNLQRMVCKRIAIA